ncbi:glycosyltransferase family 2 protein [Bacillus sp. DX1.1]|uniref:glycosyltransferase family 2 protein n=1 Tax=unclassified Bacillus (in: firmicutes) TaxID=185979 RepID=UPI00257032D8|nr:MULTISPECIES: glycosyltransferase family 2 protein [unclassified Bacillus (in: firmicutes)]MDM5157049.1 glycosyltransferase family 2 protein [Bacillus sp. DX1.1]WJE81286.1 glycosyltransferase family 2 protein [Bacillus sp. DX3.1]
MYQFGGNEPILTIVVPCYNEELVLHETTKRLSEVLEELISNQLISSVSKILYVDDGSKDTTWEIIEELYYKSPFVKGLKLARNVGHQNALLAGLNTAAEYSDCVISIDADLQDDVDAIKGFIEKFHEGYEVVYGVRQERKTDTFFKRNTALLFYRLMDKMGVNIVYNHADYRLLSHKVLMHLKEFKETNLFLRGIVPLVGFKSTEVYYDRHERFAGESKYPLKKMLTFAFEGITSFSVAPIRMITSIGISFLVLSIIISIYTLVQKISGETVSGWTSLMLSIWFIGGVQLMGIGLVGEYIGKIYKETKARPKYIVEVDLYSAPKETQKQDNQKVLTTTI